MKQCVDLKEIKPNYRQAVKLIEDEKSKLKKVLFINYNDNFKNIKYILDSENSQIINFELPVKNDTGTSDIHDCLIKIIFFTKDKIENILEIIQTKGKTKFYIVISASDLFYVRYFKKKSNIRLFILTNGSQDDKFKKDISSFYKKESFMGYVFSEFRNISEKKIIFNCIQKNLLIYPEMDFMNEFIKLWVKISELNSVNTRRDSKYIELSIVVIISMITSEIFSIISKNKNNRIFAILFMINSIILFSSTAREYCRENINNPKVLIENIINDYKHILNIAMK